MTDWSAFIIGIPIGLAIAAFLIYKKVYDAFITHKAWIFFTGFLLLINAYNSTKKSIEIKQLKKQVEELTRAKEAV
jgi:hypothetical protein